MLLSEMKLILFHNFLVEFVKESYPKNRIR